jgi:hypothetical protein
VLQNVDYALSKADEKDIRLRTDSYLDSDMKLQQMYCNQELSYEKLVSLNKKLKDVTNEMLRQAAFKSEAIQKGMIIEDFINSGRAVELGAKKMIYSLHFPERNLHHRIDRWLGWM